MSTEGIETGRLADPGSGETAIIGSPGIDLVSMDSPGGGNELEPLGTTTFGGDLPRNTEYCTSSSIVTDRAKTAP